MNFRALLLRARDLLYSFGRPPYMVRDRQAVDGVIAFYSLEKAVKAGDSDGVTAKDGEICALRLDKTVGGMEIYHFTRDRKGRLHLPKALRSRML